MGSSPDIPDVELPPSPPMPFDENILKARERAKRRALAAFGLRAATLTGGTLKPMKTSPVSLTGTISQPASRGGA